jgi:hypothetical protein
MVATPPDQHTRSSLAAPIQGSDTARFGKRMQKTNARFLLGYWFRKKILTVDNVQSEDGLTRSIASYVTDL